MHTFAVCLPRYKLEAAEFVGAFALRDEGQPGVQHRPRAPEERSRVGCVIADIVAPDGMRGQYGVFLSLRNGVRDELLEGRDVDGLAVGIRGCTDAVPGRLGVVERFQVIVNVVQDAGVVGVDQGGRTSVSPRLDDVIAGVPELRDLISLLLHHFASISVVEAVDAAWASAVAVSVVVVASDLAVSAVVAVFSVLAVALFVVTEPVTGSTFAEIWAFFFDNSHDDSITIVKIRISIGI